MSVIKNNKKMFMFALLAIAATIMILSSTPIFADLKTSGSNNLFGWIFINLLNFMLKAILGLVDSFRYIFESMFAPDVDKSTSAFQSVFTSIGNFAPGFQAIGWSLAALIFIITIIKGMLGDVYRVENPWNLTIRFVICLFIIINYSAFMGVAFKFGGGMYQTIYNQSKVYSEGSSEMNFNRKNDDGKQMSTEFSDGGDKLSSNFSDEIQKKMGDNNNWAVSLGAGILAFMLVCAIGLGYLMLMLEIIERYVLCGILYIFAPVPIAFETSEETSQVFKNFVMMIFTTMLMMAMNLFFYNVIGRALGTVIATKGTASSHTTVSAEFISLAMIYAMIRIARNFDDYLSTMGFSTARTGQGMLGEMFAAAGTIIGGWNLAARSGKMIGRGTARAADAAGRFGHEHIGPVLTGDANNGSKIHDRLSDNYQKSGAYTTLGKLSNAHQESNNMKAALAQYKSSDRSYRDLEKLNNRYNNMSPAGKDWFKEHNPASAKEMEAYQTQFNQEKNQRDLAAQQKEEMRKANTEVRNMNDALNQYRKSDKTLDDQGKLNDIYESMSEAGKEKYRNDYSANAGEVDQVLDDYKNSGTGVPESGTDTPSEPAPAAKNYSNGMSSRGSVEGGSYQQNMDYPENSNYESKGSGLPRRNK